MSAPARPDRPDLIVRELPLFEWNLLSGAPPFNRLATPSPDSTRVMVAQDSITGALVAYWFVFTAVHVEPVWIAPEHSHRPGLIRRLWRGVQSILQSSGVDLAFAVIGHHAHPENASMAQRLGFQRAPCDLFYMLTRPADPELLARIQELVQTDPSTAQSGTVRGPHRNPQPESRVPEFDLSRVFSGLESPHGAN